MDILITKQKLLLLLWQYILIQKASQTWGGKRNPGALNGKSKIIIIIIIIIKLY